MGFIGLVADAATTIQQETDEITRFFSIAHVKQLLNDLGNWSVSLIGKIVIAVLIWFIGKKIIKVLDKLVKKMLDRSTLDKGVVNFVVSVLKFVMYAILIMIVVDKLGFQTTSLLTLFGSAALAIGMSLQGSLSNFAGGILILISFKQVKSYIPVVCCINPGSCFKCYTAFIKALDNYHNILVLKYSLLAVNNLFKKLLGFRNI